MALSRMSSRPKKSSNAGTLAILVLAGWGLCGCSWVPDYANPIEWYRDLTGVSKNDAQDTGQRNQQNLQAGGAAPYPNLGTVPQPPDQAMSTIDRDKLQKGLIADRANARYSDEELRQGHGVPPLPGEAPPAQTAEAQGAAATPGQAAAPAATPGQAAAPAAGGPRRGPPVKGSEAPPQESPLTTPSMRSLPQGESPNAPPPAPGGPRPQQQAALPAAPALAVPAALPAAPADPAEQPAVMRAPRGHAPSVTLQAAEIGFAGDGKTLSAEDNQHLAEAAKLQKQGGGSLRVIGYARRGYGPDAAREDLASFGAALDRANAVAQALTKLGVPASRITVQAAPEQVAAGLGAGAAEVLLEY
jgi:outer membrane protein OmpA-like peptidoglycan-associated protein